MVTTRTPDPPDPPDPGLLQDLAYHRADGASWLAAAARLDSEHTADQLLRLSRIHRDLFVGPFRRTLRDNFFDVAAESLVVARKLLRCDDLKIQRDIAILEARELRRETPGVNFEPQGAWGGGLDPPPKTLRNCGTSDSAGRNAG